MKNRLLYIVYLFSVLFVTGCEDLEDTYDEYSGNGMVRYVGKCSDLKVQPGWNRLKVTWKGNLDAAIKCVKVSWQAENEEHPNVLYREPKSILESNDLMDSVCLENLSNAVYTITVSNLSADSTESIVEQAYARPYTQEHEDLRAFTRGIINFFILNDKLAVIVDEANPNLKEIKLHFWGTDGQEYSWDVRDHMEELVVFGQFRNSMYLLPEEEGAGIDFTKPITVKRRGTIAGCIDEINFKDEVLPLDERVFSSGFTRWLMKNYGRVADEDINTVETVELDYDMTTLQDLFYFPNLKKVILGKNRYQTESETTMNVSETDIYKALMTLQFLKNTRGVSVERYNRHYLGEFFNQPYTFWFAMNGLTDEDLVEEKGNSNMDKMPVVTPLDTTGWTVTCSDTTYNGYKTYGAAWLLDDNAATYFEPGQTLNATVVEVKIDMKKAQELHGFKVVQPAPMNATTDYKYLLASLKIEVSADDIEWNDATYENGGVIIGNTRSEVTFIDIPQAKQMPVRYIRLTMADQWIGSTTEKDALFSLRLGDFVPY